MKTVVVDPIDLRTLIIIFFMHSFHAQFSNIFNKINLEKRPTYLLGDFNIDLLKYGSDCRAHEFLDNLLTNGFYPRIDKPTKLTETTTTLIDNIFVNVHCDKIISGPWLTDMSDHLPIYTTFPYEHVSVKHKAEYIMKRFYTEVAMDAFRLELSTVNWSEIYDTYSQADVNIKFDYFVQAFDKLHNKHFPQVHIRVKNNGEYKPWISRAIKNSIKKKNNLYKKYMKELSPSIKK